MRKLKRIFIALTLMFVCFGTANAQTYRFQSYAYAQKDVGYNWSNFVNSNLTITINMDTDVIRIYNKMNSCFLVLTSREYYDNQGEWTLECNCRDEEQLKCTIRLVKRSSGTLQIYVDYSNVSWCYNVRRVN